LIDLHPFDNKEALRTSKVLDPFLLIFIIIFSIFFYRSNFAPHKDNIREIHVDIGRKSSQENLTSISDSYVISYFLGVRSLFFVNFVGKSFGLIFYFTWQCLYSNESETELVECGFRGSSLNHLHGLAMSSIHRH
jgi:hypothetical protein